MPTQVWDPQHAMDLAPDACLILEPGTLIGNRYRIGARIGRGGMGSVYMADDLTLGQRTALKFVSDGCIDEPRSLQIVLNEVTLAREVTHPNVCRVHDVGEVGGRHFLSMEFVDGEDLAALLEKIGRLPADKAHQIARQLLAGLHAAHAHGVIHRDLKPANVLLDRSGDVRITDFGIAGRIEANPAQGTGSTGTPAYMAPELFTGGQASPQSDLFSVGLLLYEIYTGQRLFKASTMTELLEQHREPIVPPSHIVSDLDPRVEKAILKCLQRRPEDRPTSAIAVLAQLPGGDPLHELIASGVTPSIESVESCGGRGTLSRGVAYSLVAVAVLALIAVFGFKEKTTLLERVDLPKSGEVLADRAADVVKLFGFDETGYREYGFGFHEGRFEKLCSEADPHRWCDLTKSRLIDFWYRVSPEPLVALGLRGRVTAVDPPVDRPGMALLRIDPSGRLRELVAVGSRRGKPAEWSKIFEAAGLDFASFSEHVASHAPPVFADRLHAWRSGLTVVEAATRSGHAVSFRVVEKAPLADGATASAKPVDQGHDVMIAKWFQLILILGGAWLAWDAFRSGKACPQRILRFAAVVFVLQLAAAVLTGSHSADLEAEAAVLLRTLATALLATSQLTLFYVALEPHARRIWPETLISWSRLVAGRVRDPMVGRNVLFGIPVGLIAVLMVWLSLYSMRMTGDIESPPFLIGGGSVAHEQIAMDALAGSRFAAGAILETVVFGVFFGFTMLMGLVLLTLVFRNRWLGVAGYIAMQTAMWVHLEALTVVSIASFAILAALCTFVLIRVGVLALIGAAITYGLVGGFPLALDLSSWQAGSTLLVLAILVAAAAFGVWLATGRGGDAAAQPAQ